VFSASLQPGRDAVHADQIVIALARADDRRANKAHCYFTGAKRMSIVVKSTAMRKTVKPTHIAVIALSLLFVEPALGAQHFASSLGAVSSLCTFQSNLDYEPALLADFSKPTPEINSFANQGLIIGLAGAKGALDEFVIFDQNRFDATPITIDMSIEGGAFDFHGKRDELKIGKSASPTSECDMVSNGQTFTFELKTIDPQFVALWKTKLAAMTGDAAPHAKSLSKYISSHNQYWMMKN
jgi:hypothetical protein